MAKPFASGSFISCVRERTASGKMLEQIIAHGGVTLTEIRNNDGRLIRHLSELPVIMGHMLKHMNLPANLYECLLE